MFEFADQWIGKKEYVWFAFVDLRDHLHSFVHAI
jgi:hypothetical protein